MKLTLHLQTCGLLLIALAALHPYIACRFRWREELAGVSLFARQVFWVHTLFIAFILLQFGVVSLVFSKLLLERSALARVILFGFVSFWGLRLFAQHFVYSSALWRGNRLHTVMHIIFTALWTYLVVVYGKALWLQFVEA
jgi:hypothetical protein